MWQSFDVLQLAFGKNRMMLRQVHKLGINALKALASELGMSVCGSHSMFCS